jgi:hypothetical protein
VFKIMCWLFGTASAAASIPRIVILYIHTYFYVCVCVR